MRSFASLVFELGQFYTMKSPFGMEVGTQSMTKTARIRGGKKLTCTSRTQERMISPHDSLLSLIDMQDAFPPFQPPAWLRNGHLQTLAALALVGPRPSKSPIRHQIKLPDGDTIVLTEDRPPAWHSGDRVAVLVHGLAGSHLSPYMRRIAHKLAHAGVRTFRLDLRGCGAGDGLAKLPYHAGLTADLRAAIAEVACQAPSSPVALVGFSLGGNMVLKLLGEPAGAPGNVNRGIAICPPIDLADCCRSLDHGLARFYDRHFVSLLTKKAREELQRLANRDGGKLVRPRTLFQFDDCYTAPVSGFKNAEHYYEESGAAAYIANIKVPTTVLAANDDPVVPKSVFANVTWPTNVRLIETQHGGHLGYIARRGTDPDGCWMDWRVVDWVTDSSPSPARRAVL
jgi:predicted alpha/beta-fold hydrolase